MAVRLTDSSPSSVTDDVTLVRWPEDRATLDRLRALGRPRLLLVDPAAPAPLTNDLDEDWIRLPASDEDLRARATSLAAKAASAAPRPATVGDGRLVHRGAWVGLSPTEEQILAALVGAFGEVVPLRRLTDDLDGHALTANAVRVHVMRLRKRIQPLGLTIRTVHGRGYLIEPAEL